MLTGFICFGLGIIGMRLAAHGFTSDAWCEKVGGAVAGLFA